MKGLTNVARRGGHEWVRRFSEPEYAFQWMPVSCLQSSELAFLSINGLRTAYQNRKVNATQSTELMLSRIDTLRRELKFMVNPRPCHARRQAEDKLDADDPDKSLLYAVPFSVQDTRWNMENSAEGILLGYNSMWAGQCANPYDPSRAAMGSSGGSATAVATGCSYFAVATDSLGSVPVAASANGVVAVVPNDRSGIFSYVGQARNGILARSLEDVAVVCGQRYLSALDVDPDQSLKVAVFDGGDLCTEEIRVQFNAAVETLASMDSHLLISADFTTALQTGSPAEQFESMSWKLQEKVRVRLRNLFAKYDVILQPTLFCDPWLKGQAHANANRPGSWSQATLCNFSRNAVGSMPFAMSAAGLPMGLHIAVNEYGTTKKGGTNSTALLLQVMRRVEKALRFRVPPPFMPLLTYGAGRPILPFLEKKPKHKCSEDEK